MYDCLVIGGGQAGLACGYYLRKAHLTFAILDDQNEPGGAWQHTWPSLTLFSPAGYSSLPGWMMPEYTQGFPPSEHVIAYLRAYENRYQLPVHRPVAVTEVHHDGSVFTVKVTHGGNSEVLRAHNVISATGTWSQPHCPSYPGLADFTGTHVHSAHYQGVDGFRDQRVAVVGGGNSGAQIAAELSAVASVRWLTMRTPKFLPDDVDGRVLFQVATQHARHLAAGTTSSGGIASLGDIVAVPEVREARDSGRLFAEPMFTSLTPSGAQWADGTTDTFDQIVWCTGFRPALRHLQQLRIRDAAGRIGTNGTACEAIDGLFLVGYGDWTGPASATLIGVGKTARDTVYAIQSRMN
ncbi:NAD(P)/FAD-dependent oxidoreductase [Hoyosella rhizosphaerae]|nr:NAD(P)/FAD-dependent oxidoreductase [Hoyosella rhizosphaerae]